MARWLLVIPPVLFAGLAAMFYVGMQGRDPHDLPSVFIGKPAPTLPVTGLPGTVQLTDTDLRAGEVTVVNFWASWCPPCRAEHPVLADMAAQGIRVAGVNMMDKEADALGYLAEEGNPFFALATDPDGRNRVEWGVTNPPETFIVDGDGKVLFKFIGPLIGGDYERRFVPALKDALQ
ncbi:DsbE family thiol:disulfide interchange protein [Rhodobacter sp. Har01]|uniref:DsbE family thiol:disulfide interchange protein n=1 Tax=Rhodobacter sp. Har01 TaxID=2883999 RepID=UPI001D06C662|nr:DsbE family thiol:disulfide interchange protein [Rhodobacter sp. Har01]MCB6177444.1 DsbE family thiol:disulfide interchange protein [Rhodobacter sp. Har01]